MKHLYYRRENKTASLIVISLIFAVLAATAAFCLHRFMLDDQDEYDEDEDEDYIGENGVRYCDERNFVD